MLKCFAGSRPECSTFLCRDFEFIDLEDGCVCGLLHPNLSFLRASLALG